MVELLDVVLPIISLIVFALLTLPVFRVIRKSQRKTALTLAWFFTVFAVTGAAVANLAFKYYSLPSPQPFLNVTVTDESFAALSSAFMIDAVSVYMAIIFVVVSAVVFLYTVVYVDSSKRPSERYYAGILMLPGAVGGGVVWGGEGPVFRCGDGAAAGSGFLMVYKKNPVSLNSTLKYLVMIIIASAFIVFGLSIVYGLTGTLNFWAVKHALTILADKHLLLLAFVFIVAGYAIESAVVPFHFWLPDAYSAAPSSSSAFLSALIDQGSYYVLIRVLVFILTPAGVLDWTLMLAVMAALTMVVGNLFALIQDDVKRLIANICVADVGYNLVAITSVTAAGLRGNLFFFLVGGITTAMAFMALGIINRYGFKTLEDFSGLGRKMPLASFALFVAALSFAGVPSTGGFMAKYLVVNAVINTEFSWLAVILVLMSVLQTAYLFRLVNYIYGKKPKDDVRIKEPLKLIIPVFILVAAIIIVGVYPSIVLGPIEHVIQQFPFVP